MSTRDHPDWWRPVGGQNSQDSTLERRSLIWNNGATPIMIDMGNTNYRSKFFTRGCRGFIHTIGVYCDNPQAVPRNITLGFAPYPGCGYLYYYNLAVPGLAAPAWRDIIVNRFWNYDAIFIWWQSANDVAPRVGYDAETPFDYMTSTDAITWVVGDARYWVRVQMTGETPGDVPVSGTLNVIKIPNVSAEVNSITAAGVASGAWAVIGSYCGCGEVVELIMEAVTAVVPAAGVQYQMRVIIDGVLTVLIGNRQLTQSVIATAGRCSMGEFFQDGASSWLWVRIPLQFQRYVTLNGLQSSGAPANITGQVIAHVLR